MVLEHSTAWATGDFCLSAHAEPTAKQLETVAAEVYSLACRTDFSAPGFCLIDLGSDASSQSLRRFMVRLKRAMQGMHQRTMDRDLVFVSAGRFDQQVTTKPHRDGGPEESLLMLGYEPSQVPAEIAMSDYSHCAFELGITPAEFLQCHNPMFAAVAELLRPYTTPIRCFSHESCQVLIVNNSVASFQGDLTAWQGVLHTATVLRPNDGLRRVVNSTMVASVPLGDAEPLSDQEQEDFVSTFVVRRRGYDKPHLDDEL